MAVYATLELEFLSSTPLYFKNEGSVLIEKGSFKIIKRIDLHTLFDPLNKVNSAIALLDKNSEISGHADFMKYEILNETSIIKGEINRLYDLVGVSRRSRRGVLNFVGDGLKFLFGTLSDSDLKDINNALNQINSNENVMANQITAVLHVIQDMNEANSKLHENQKSELEQLNSVIKRLNTIDNLIDEEHNLNTIRQAQAKLLNLVESVRNQVTRLHNAILILKAGVIDTFLLDRQELATAINGADLGYKMLASEVEDLLNFCPINVISDTINKFIYIIVTVPRVDERKFALFSMIPIPQIINKKTMIMTNIKKHLLISEKLDYFW